MIEFVWHRRGGHRGGVRTVYELRAKANMTCLGTCFYLAGSKLYRCSASAPVNGGVVLTEYYAGTMAAARAALERDWSKRSIGLFGEDDIRFHTRR